ncbi:MAG TPA: response regulator transcription factor [Anaerolineae bacterium]|jgi:DNA-binding response OmpR family regulator|nr:response regulator transcription factor [Anaerolineae bacterium]
MPKVLLIDDDPQLQEILTKVLVKQKFKVITADDGTEGLQQAKKHSPDAIVLDIIMPGMDGFEVAQRLGRDRTCAHIPIMVLTAYAAAFARNAAEEAGVKDFVAKPFTIDDFVTRLKAMMVP